MILAVLPVAIVTAVLAYNFTASRLHDVELRLAERAMLIARNLALGSEFALVSRNVLLMGDVLQHIADEPEVRWAGIWDREQRVMISRGSGPDNAKTNEIVSAIEANRGLPPGCYYVPVRLSNIHLTDFIEEYSSQRTNGDADPNELLGFAVVEMGRERASVQRAEIQSSSVLITVVGLFGSVLLALLIGNTITEPITRVLKAVRELRGGNLAARVTARSGGELGNLEQGLNQMAESLQGAQRDLETRVEEATGALRDTVAEMELRNLELDQARQLALHAGRERIEFLARMSHEIRTPLNAVVGFAKLLGADGRPESNDEHVRTIQRAAGQLLHVINDILQFTRLDAGADQIESLPFSLGDLLEDVVAMLGPMAHEKRLDLVLLQHNDLPQTLHGDPDRLSQVIINLVNNAIKFTTQGHVLLEASRLTDESGSDQIEIAITDTGIGIDEAERVNIFEAFSQSDSSITRRFGGTGLGLAITKRLCELMDGDIKLQSAKGKGSRFSIHLPCRGCSAPALIESEGPFAGRKVLVYDVNPFMRRSLRNVLALWDMRVFNTGRWEQVLQMVTDADEHGAFDLLILGLSYAEQKEVVIGRYLSELRRHYAGRLILLTGSDNWMPPGSGRPDERLGWATKPVRRSTLKRLLDISPVEKTSDGTSTEKALRPQRLLGMQVLVAEDNDLNRQLLRFLLEEEGATVDEAVSGAVAVDAATRGGYDAILMDLHLPGIDGAEATRQIRAHFGAEAPPIFALTADVFGQSHLAGAEESFDDWLLKPVDPELLIGRLSKLRGQNVPSASSRNAMRAESGRKLPAVLHDNYLTEVERLVDQVRGNLLNEDATAISQSLHDLKGIVGMCGDEKLLVLAQRLTSDLLDTDPADAKAFLNEVKHAARLASMNLNDRE
jgi:two-component system sensor histidine kinase BarA